MKLVRWLHNRNLLYTWIMNKSIASQDLLKAKNWDILQWPSQPPDLTSIEHLFQLTLSYKQAAAEGLQNLSVKKIDVFIVKLVCSIAVGPLELGGLCIKMVVPQG